MIAARDGKTSCLKLLIRKGARINLSRNRVCHFMIACSIMLYVNTLLVRNEAQPRYTLLHEAVSKTVFLF